MMRTVTRGQILTALTGDHAGDNYLLVQETDRAFSKNAVGEREGYATRVFNLVNLGTGKTRVSEPTRKLMWKGSEVPVQVIEKHFGMNVMCAATISDIATDITAGIQKYRQYLPQTGRPTLTLYTPTGQAVTLTMALA